MTTVSADIQKYEVSSDGNIYYFIKVVFNGREWAVRKRYSDFSKLDEYLMKDGFQLSYALPSKQFWNRFDKKTLAERQKGLQSYLNILLTNTVSSDNSLVKEFLEVDHNRLQHLRKQSFHALRRTERMESVISIMSRSVLLMPVKNTNKALQQQHQQEQSTSITRGRQGSSSGTTPNQFGSGPNMQKSKSLSFSMKFSFSSNSRKNSFQPENRQSFVSMERKNSLDYVPSSNKSSSVDVATLKDLLKKEAYEYGVNALWERYEAEINQVIAEADYLKTNSSNNSSSSSNRENKRSALPISHFRTRSSSSSSTSTSTSTDSPSSARKKMIDIVTCMSQPVAKIGDNSATRYLDAHLRQKASFRHAGTTNGSTSPSTSTGKTEMLGIAECERESDDMAAMDAEDQQIVREAAEFVAFQQKYNVLVYLVEQN